MSGERVLALLLAAGSGARLGRDRPKAFVPLAGRPLVAWSLLALARHPQVTDVLVVVPPGWDESFRSEVLGGAADELRGEVHKIWGVVPGGARRQDSARIGLEAATGILPAGAPALVLVHDAARALVGADLIGRVVTHLAAGSDTDDEPRPGVIPVVPESETLKEVGGPGARVVRTVPRQGLWRAQTPQGFDLRALLEAHRAADAEGLSATDDAMLFEWRGWPVEAVAGSATNLKITDREDLAWAEAWLGHGAGIA
jgi:2-C-methyl-D-erythritol 4-phosphate cytidylyltransferase/2-C-methyl-D-erythritol 2,4-cyclodiphosphate synthase